MNKTKIEWCDSTWSPITGCWHDCPYCYARRIANRFGVDISFMKISKPVELLRPVLDENGNRIPFPTMFIPTFHRYRLGEYANKKGRTIFVCSMADLFGEWIPDEWISAVFDDCRNASQHRYLFLTKNPARYIALAEKGLLPKEDNMWYGTSVPTPKTEFFWADGYQTFISIEPVLEDFGSDDGAMSISKAKWIIVGAETGNRKEKVIPKPVWIDHIRAVCNREHIPLFMKNSLLPVVGEENMVREFPWGKERYGVRQ